MWKKQSCLNNCNSKTDNRILWIFLGQVEQAARNVIIAHTWVLALQLILWIIN